MFIFFDIDGTLVDHDKAANLAAARFQQRFAAQLQYSHAEFLKVWHDVSDRHNDLYFQGRVSLIEQRRNRMREIFRHSEPTLSAREADLRFQFYLEHYESNWTLFDDVIPCLDRLAHLSLGLISNGNLEQQRRKLRQTGLAERFSTVVISSEIGIGKPARQIFLEACKRANVRPADCLYVGDRLDVDVIASCAVGMKSIWLNRKQAPVPDAPMHVIAKLDELEKLLLTSVWSG